MANDANIQSVDTRQGRIDKVQGDAEPKDIDYEAEQASDSGKQAGERARTGAAAAQSSIAGAAQVQAKLDYEQAKGYVGEVADPTPNEVYALPNPGYGDGGQVAPELEGIKGRAKADALSRGLTRDDFADAQAAKDRQEADTTRQQQAAKTAASKKQ